LTNITKKGVSIFKKNWKNFRDGIEASLLPKNAPQAMQGYREAGHHPPRLQLPL